jgi:dipeptidyl aminopeptidase/acylaminoacyl peptidase
MAETRHWSVERQITYPLITELSLSPDGRQVVFVVREPLMTDEKSEFISHLYLASLDGGDPIQLTFGEHSNSGARWSPDGLYIAFISTRSGKGNMYVMRAAGGEAWALTTYKKTDVCGLKWAPNGKQIGFLMPEPHSEVKDKAAKAKNDPILWDVDFDFTHLYVTPFAIGPRAAPEARQITRGRYQIVDFDWLPDGQTLAITHCPTPVADTWTEIRLATIPADGSAEAPNDLALVADWGARPKVSPDGRWIACGTGDQPAHWAFANRVFLYPVGGGEPRALAETPDRQVELIGWSADGGGVYVLEPSGVASQIWMLPASGEPARQLTDTPLLKTVPVANTGDRIAFVGQDFDRPNAVYLLDAAAASARQIAEPPMPADWPQAALPRAEVIQWQAPDGKQIEGIVAYPQDYRPGQRYPLIVAIHGGPTGVYQRGYLAAPDAYSDVAGLAERGYVVLRANPRGSSGYGRAFRFANYGDWGGGDYQDIMAGVDHLIRQGIADADKLGIMGWSYGGYLTSWTITQTDRFKAACVGAAVTNLMSFNGTSDIPGFIPDYFSAEAWDDLEPYRNHSPLFQVKGVKTPTLIQHGDSDVRVPLSQGRELYNALKRQGAQVEMVIYPRQAHLLGEPRLVMDVRRRAVEWFERWIQR